MDNDELKEFGKQLISDIMKRSDKYYADLAIDILSMGFSAIGMYGTSGTSEIYRVPVL